MVETHAKLVRKVLLEPSEKFKEYLKRYEEELRRRAKLLK